MSARPRDLAWEALVEVTGATVSSERGALNAALKAIRDACPEHSEEDLAGEIRYRSETYRKTFPGMALTPTALSKHWERIPLEAPVPTYPSAPPNECATCKGDRLVVYSERPVEGGVPGTVHVYEEFAPCPDCNPTANTGFWRWDGTRFNSPDSGLVRRRLG